MAVMLSEQTVRLWDLQRLELIASASIQQFRDIKGTSLHHSQSPAVGAPITLLEYC